MRVHQDGALDDIQRIELFGPLISVAYSFQQSPGEVTRREREVGSSRELSQYTPTKHVNFKKSTRQ